MPYFQERYPEVRFPVAEGNSPGFRKAQLGAAWAISSHFTQRTEPALVTMPTGSGKTAVLILIAFMLRSERTLVLTPNVLVRDQIFEEVKTLKTLLRVGALPQNTPGPNIKVVAKRITTEQDWENLRAFDVVVATPHSLSPGLAPIPSPPVDLFDLILVDEAHHSPARTWSELLEAFPSAKKVLFTATPFRRDRGEIKAKFVYTYSLRRAYAEGVFGNIRYIPISDPGGDVPVDVALAIKAMEVLRQDRESGFDHYLMVRTDSKKKANELRKIYSDYTDLNLQLVHSGYSYKRIRETIKKLREGELDGIICVAMLGEGFDLPQLKIAAIHAPHKSLEVTLQFIGRFARTTRETIGEAKFLAVPNDLKLETERLYREDAVWQEIVANLSASRIDAEVGLQDDLSTFSMEMVAQEDLSDLSLYSLEPYQHVKIYSVRSLNLAAPIRLPPSFSIVYENYSEELSARVVITRETEQPKWTDQERFERAEYDLFVLYYNQAASLLFINSSRRSVGIYETIAASVSSKSHRILPLFKINRVLRELRSIECFNIGMRNRAKHASVETYRIMAGAQTQKGISKTTGRLFNRGHVFAKVDGDEASTTIGYSSGSKVWSNGYAKIPEQIDWCKVIAEKILNDQEFSTGSELDDLPLSSALIGIPDTVIALDWHEEFYLRPFDVHYSNEKEEVRCPILDCDLTVEHANGDSIVLKISSEGFGVPVVYRNDGGRFFEKLESNGSRLDAMLPTEVVDFVDCLNDFPLSFYTPDLSRVCGEEKFPGWLDAPPYDIDRIEVWDWKDLGVDIECEYETDAAQSTERMSIHACLATRLRDGYEVVFYDHGPGEIADFLTLKVEGQTVVIALYHCKASSSVSPGERVADIYEVAGQVVKSTLWLKRPSDLQKKIERRMKRGSRFVKGTIEDLRRVLAIAAIKGTRYEIVLVQPGISAVKLTEVGLSILGAAHGYVNSAGLFEMRVISSL
jgi:superfamily II DNA or RNA helicase